MNDEIQTQINIIQMSINYYKNWLVSLNEGTLSHKEFVNPDLINTYKDKLIKEEKKLAEMQEIHPEYFI